MKKKRIKVRQVWKIKPVMKVKKSIKVYSRKNALKEIKEALG